MLLQVVQIAFVRYIFTWVFPMRMCNSRVLDANAREMPSNQKRATERDAHTANAFLSLFPMILCDCVKERGKNSHEGSHRALLNIPLGITEMDGVTTISWMFRPAFAVPFSLGWMFLEAFFFIAAVAVFFATKVRSLALSSWFSHFSAPFCACSCSCSLSHTKFCSLWNFRVLLRLIFSLFTTLFSRTSHNFHFDLIAFATFFCSFLIVCSQYPFLSPCDFVIKGLGLNKSNNENMGVQS